MSYSSNDSSVLNQQLRVQELCLLANNTLVAVDGSDLLVSIGEPLSSAIMGIKQVAAGTLTGVVVAVDGTDNTKIRITGESAAAATTKYLLKYVVA